jgi:translocation and assembly module TamB
LKIDKVRLIWSRLALLSRRLQVDQLTIGHMQFLRRPLPPSLRQRTNPRAAAILPELPVKVVVKQFAIQELSLGEPVKGVAARLDVSGKATLGPPSEGARLTLARTARRARRIQGADDLCARYRQAHAQRQFRRAGRRHLSSRQSSRLPPARLALNGAGPLDNFTAKLDFSAGPDVWANGQAVARRDAGRRLTLDLNSRLEGMTPPIMRPVFAETTLKGDLD